MALFTLMVAVFIHPELVIKPGLDQLGAAYLVMVSTIGLTFSVQAKFSDVALTDRAIRLGLATMALYILFSFNDVLSTIVSFVVLAVIGYWLVYRRKVEEVGIEEVELDDKSELASAGGAALGRMN